MLKGKRREKTMQALRGKAGVITAVMVFGLTYGLTAPLVSLRLSAAGYSEGWIGLNAAMHAVGVFAIAPLLPALCRRFSPQALMRFSLFAIFLTLCLFPFAPLASWFALRLLLGAFSEIILVVTETWLNHVSVERTRATTLAWYMASLSLGFALGPFLLLAGSGTLPFFYGALLALAAALILLRRRTEAPLAQEKAGAFWRYLALAPLAMAATLLNAALEAAGMNLLVIYAMNLGWSEKLATALLSVLMLGAIVLQLPVGWLADRFDRARLVVLFAAVSTLGALAWPWALRVAPLAWVLMFLWGGAFVAIYTLVITQVGERFCGTALTGVYAAMSIMWGAGALVGPSLAGLAMNAGAHGLPWLAAALCGAFTLYAWWMTRRAA
ncbi:MFS transporter [Franconibacter pulveris 601]|uniref:MFS transporter n=1 Tax=Franconibacter pulveris TaxID=435910 RepID=UPI001F33C911|nr:MFS transporter [Franconibacter pulveris]